jgi:hypothetical protein
MLIALNPKILPSGNTDGDDTSASRETSGKNRNNIASPSPLPALPLFMLVYVNLQQSAVFF